MRKSAWRWSAFIKEKGLPVKLITMTVGRANPPDAIKNQRIETATQEQRIQTEQQTRLAEIQRKSAEEARAAADNAYRQAIGLSPEQYVQLKRIEMEQRVCADGQVHVHRELRRAPGVWREVIEPPPRNPRATFRLASPSNARSRHRLLPGV